jgi:hypothetical protein
MLKVSENIGPILVRDVTGQKAMRLKAVPSDATILEVVKQLLGDMDMPPNDPEGRPVNYRAHLERGSLQLGDNERVGDVLQANDSLRLFPNIDAGR